MRAMKDKADDRAGDRGQPPLTMPRPDNGLPEDIREHMRLMCDIIALGFQTDKTRIATLLLCRDISGLFYPFLDVRTAHHPASHDDRSDAYERVTRYYVGQLAYLAARLDAMPEGEGTVLDNSCLLFTSNMWSGTEHDATKVPAPPRRRPGRHARRPAASSTTASRGDDNRKLCSLYLSLMDRMGVTLDHFGDADDAPRRALSRGHLHRRADQTSKDARGCLGRPAVAPALVRAGEPRGLPAAGGAGA